MSQPAALSEDDAAIDSSSKALNPFFRQSVLSSAFEHLEQTGSFGVVQLEDDGSTIARLPLQKSYRLGRVPFWHWQTYSHDYQFLGDPLIAPGAEDQFAHSLVSWLASGNSPGESTPSGGR